MPVQQTEVSISLNDLLPILRGRVGDTGVLAGTDAQLKDYLRVARDGLYPTFFRELSVTTAGTTGPLYARPTYSQDIYAIGYLRPGGARYWPIKGWREGNSLQVFIPIEDLTGNTVVWSWTAGFHLEASDDAEDVVMPANAVEVLLLRAQLAVFQAQLAAITLGKKDNFLAQQARQQITEDDLLNLCDDLRASIRLYEEGAKPFPQKVQ